MKQPWAWFLAGWMVAGVRLSAQADTTVPASATSTYLQQLQIKLEHTAARVNQPSSAPGSSVVGLRGSKQESASKQLYWKSVKGPAPVSADEVKLFRTAVEQARAGNNTQAIGTLQDFQKKYPQSAFAPDVQQTLQMLTGTPVAKS